MARISTSSSGGVVSIQDTNGSPITATGGSINVNVTGSDAIGADISVYNEVTSVPMGSSVTVLTYTVPVGQTLSLSEVSCSSDSIGTIELGFDAITNAKSRFSYLMYNVDFSYGKHISAAGTVITVVATNNSLQGVASFNATLKGTVI